MGPPSFDLNPHLKIGLPEIDKGDFSHHTVACTGKAVTDELFDACVQVDGDDDPSANDSQHDWLIPSNVVFGDVNDKEYRFRLAVTPGDCNLPVKLIRRRVGLTLESKQASHSRFLELSRENSFIRFYQLNEFVELSWTLRGFRFLDSEMALYLNQSFWRHQLDNESALAIDAFECVTEKEALTVFDTVLSGFELSDLVRRENQGFGDIVFAVPTNFAIVFKRDRFVFRFRNIGERPLPCHQFAQFVDTLILSDL
jgi:hypothetical protein